MKENKDRKKQLIIMGILIVILIIVDQVIKIVIQNIGEIKIGENGLVLHVVENTGGAFGIGQNSGAMFIITNIIVLGIIFKFLTSQNQIIDTKTKVCLSLIIAGGVSNLIDRIFRGYVVDIIDFSKIINFPVINLADVFITIGWVGLAAFFAAYTVKEYRKNKK